MKVHSGADVEIFQFWLSQAKTVVLRYFSLEECLFALNFLTRMKPNGGMHLEFWSAVPVEYVRELLPRMKEFPADCTFELCMEPKHVSAGPLVIDDPRITSVELYGLFTHLPELVANTPTPLDMAVDGEEVIGELRRRRKIYGNRFASISMSCSTFTLRKLHLSNLVFVSNYKVPECAVKFDQVIFSHCSAQDTYPLTFAATELVLSYDSFEVANAFAFPDVTCLHLHHSPADEDITGMLLRAFSDDEPHVDDLLAFAVVRFREISKLTIGSIDVSDPLHGIICVLQATKELVHLEKMDVDIYPEADFERNEEAYLEYDRCITLTHAVHKTLEELANTHRKPCSINITLEEEAMFSTDLIVDPTTKKVKYSACCDIPSLFHLSPN